MAGRRAYRWPGNHQGEQQRIESLISAASARAKPIVDGATRKSQIRIGIFLTPRSLTDCPASQLANTEIFARTSLVPRIPLMRRWISSPQSLRNQASLFTTSGSAARKFRYEAPQQLGINIGVARDGYFPSVAGKKVSSASSAGRDAVEFFTESKIVIERWSRRNAQF